MNMIYAIKIKGSEMYLSEDDSYTPNPLDARNFLDFADAKSYASGDEDVVTVDKDGKVEVIE